MEPKDSDIQTSLVCNGYKARIRVDGKDVPHYAIDVDEEKKEGVCWISSEAGKPFTIVVDKVFPAEVLESRMTFCVDGSTVARYAVPTQDIGCSTTASGVAVSKTECRELLFADMEFTDDDSLLEASKSTQIGEIKVIVDKVTLTKTTRPASSFSLPDTGKLHERAKKGLNHQVKMGASIERPSTESYSSVVLGTLATFYFRYRPLAMLQANGLTPHTVSNDAPPSVTGKRERSEASEDKDDADDEDEDDEVVEVTVEEEERRLLEQLEKVRQKKLEIARSRKKIKTEEKTYFTPGEVIDLT